MSSPSDTSSAKPAVWSRLRSLALQNRLFLIVVLAPTLLSAIYYGTLASDIYISESRFIVRTPQRQQTSLGSLLQSTGFSGFSRSQDDIYTVHEYIASRDALALLNQELSLKESFSSPEIDRLMRFPGLDFDDSFEALHRYYQNRVNVSLDSTSSISTLTVNAFSAEQAKKINELLLDAAERLVNKLNERGRHDLIQFAAKEVELAEHKAKEAALALSNYRNQKAVVNPEQQTVLHLQQISKLQDELIATKAQLTQVRTFTAENPQIPLLQKRLSTLESEIRTEMAKITGNGPSLTNKAAEYERLALERAFAEKQLSAALASLEQARNDAQRKQLYLERIVQPNMPDVATEPRRLRAVLTTLLLGLVTMGVLSILLAGVREHKD